MKRLGLDGHVVRAIRTLGRIDRPAFRTRMTFPTPDGETTVAAITYFYEPFLEAFDPELREPLNKSIDTVTDRSVGEEPQQE